MSTEIETERLIFESIPHSPVELRQFIEQNVRSNVRRQTRINDCKWLGLTFGILAFVVTVQWFICRSAQIELQEFCRTEISSPETAQFLMAHLKNSKSSNSGVIAPRDAQENEIPGT